MSDLLHQFKREAKVMAARRMPRFYDLMAAELFCARNTFFDHPMVQRCRDDVVPFLEDKYGHGIKHSKTVAIEAGAIVLAETRTWNIETSRHLTLLALLAGLLHDVCRMEEDHATRGAELAATILQDYPLSDHDIGLIVFAVHNHEAFKNIQSSCDPQAGVLSGALYDADKFRWGPDNFVTTLWEMSDFLDWPLQKLIARFPDGMAHIGAISTTFRTETGREYGPEFIDIGLDLGNAIYRRMLKLCRETACDQHPLNHSLGPVA